MISKQAFKSELRQLVKDNNHKNKKIENEKYVLERLFEYRQFYNKR